MPALRTSLSQFSLVDGRRRNHTDAIACREPSRRPFGPERARFYVLAEHAAASGLEHRFCQVVMREVQLAFAAEEGAGTAMALTRALMLVNRNLWQGAQELPPHRRLPIGLAVLAIDGADAYVCQMATGQIFIVRDQQVHSLPSLDHWQKVAAGVVRPSAPLGEDPDLVPAVMRVRLAAGDHLVLASTNLARLIDQQVLTSLMTSSDETPVSGLCRLAEDYGLNNTCALVVGVAGSGALATVAEPLALEPVGLAPLDRAAPRQELAPAETPAQAVVMPVAVAAAAVAPPVAAPKVEPSATVDAAAPLPDNVVRLYERPPMAAPEDDIDEPAPVPARHRPQPVARSRRARWLDALAASMLAATETLRRPQAPAPRAASRRRVGRQVAERVPEPLYRATGKLLPAGVPGFVLPNAAALNLRWPSVSLNSVLIVALVVAASLLAVVGLQSLSGSRSTSAPPPAVTARTAADERPAPVVVPATEPAVVTAAPLAASEVTFAPPPALVSPDAADRARAKTPLIVSTTSSTTMAPAVVLADLGTAGTPPTTPKQLIVGRGQVYVLDPYTSTLYQIDSAGKPQATLLARGWSIAKEKVQDLLGVTWRGDTLVVMDRSRAYTLDGPNGTWRVAPLAAASLGAGVHQVASYDGGLYVLDSARGQVLKYAQGAYQKAPQPWIKSTEKADLAGAVDLAIDGRIYALTASGQLVTLLRGEVERRQAITATPALNTPVALVSPPNSAFLYVAEAGGRVLKLTKDGVVVGQYQAAGTDLANLSSFWVDEATQTVYAVAGNKVVRTGLPVPTLARLS